MVQEHWYFEKDLNVFQNLIGNVHMHGISGMNEDDLLIGRPFGGCAILINNHLKCTFSPFQISNRCCGGILKSQNMSILLLNVYMPCDTQYDVGNIDLYNDVLNEISSLCMELFLPTVLYVGSVPVNEHRPVRVGHFKHHRPCYKFVKELTAQRLWE